MAAIRTPEDEILVISYSSDLLRLWDADEATPRHALNPGVTVRAMTARGTRLFLAGDFGVAALDLGPAT